MRTVVHLVRHGEVHNPVGILYGRRPGYHLSDLGKQMATRVAEVISERDITGVYASPLERAQETAQPLADALALDLRTDERVIESSNVFEGQTFGAGQGVLKHPRAWRHLWNPLRPSWGEPYKQVVARMLDAVHDVRDAHRGHEAVVVSHQLPIWITRLHLEDKPFLHDPRKRHCTLCSLTSLTFEDDRLTTLTYSEPAGDLIPVHDRNKTFSSGGSAPSSGSSGPSGPSGPSGAPGTPDASGGSS